MNITKALLIVMAIAVALLAVWIIQRPADPAPEQPAARQGIPDDPDGRVLQQLVAAGADLTQPHNVDFLLYLPNEDKATKACDTLKTEGYLGKVRSAGAEEWQCLAKTEAARYTEVEQAIRELHSYEEPEILAIPIVAGSKGYLDWISESLEPDA